MNDDNNDELFRRAAENYPLKTDNPDWDAVLGKMNSAETPEEPEPAKKKRKNYRFLLLLLLLIPFAIYESRKSQVNEPVAGKKEGAEKPAIAKTALGEPDRGIAVDEKKDQPATQPDQIIQTENPVQKVPTVITDQKVNNAVKVTDITADNYKDPPGKRSAAFKQRTTTSITSAQASADGDNNIIASSNKRKTASKQRSKMNITNAQADEDEVVTVNYPAKKDKSKIQGNANADSETSGDNENITSVKKETAPINKNDIAKTNVSKEDSPAEKEKIAITDSATKKKEKEITKADDKKVKDDKKKKTSQKHFYVGLIAGPDFSTVKLQSVKKTGLGYGLIIGYHLSKKISIETGIIRDKKYYSTDGKYFTKGDNIPVYDKIEYVSGNCSMWELPIKINYSFINRAKTSVFGSVGVSSYFMRHESYVYDLSYAGFVYPRSYDYDNRSTSLFAAINISAGYTYKLGKIGNLRVEPYIKLPINKIGTGKLPVQSAGLYVGFTKDIF